MLHNRFHPQHQWHPQNSQHRQHPQNQQHPQHPQQPYPDHQRHPNFGDQRHVQPEPQRYPGPFQMPSHPHEHQMSRQLTIEDAIGIARDQVEGQVVQAELERRGSRLIYEVDIISNQGAKYEVKVDATTGEVIEVELD